MRMPVLALLLSSCSAAPVPAAVQTPGWMLSCAGPARAPAPLPTLRTVDQLATWAARTERARQRSERAREDCATRLHELAKWVEDHKRETQ